MMALSAPAAGTDVPTEQDFAAHLLVYFKDETHRLHMALSSDDYSFTDVNKVTRS